MPKSILTISGTDASGKESVSKLVQKRLAEKNVPVDVISPPFYDTPIGGEVANYLRNGYGCWRDRKIASAMYSVDRNWWMRENFDRVFRDKGDGIALYNRNWIDSIFFQTTLTAQTPEDTQRFHEISQRFFVAHDTNGHEQGPTMDDLRKVFEPTNFEEPDERTKYLSGVINIMTPEEREELQHFYMFNRYAMVQAHINFIYQLEVEPYKIPVLPDGRLAEEHPIHNMYANWNVFTEVLRMCNVVLMPRRPHVKEIVYQNLLRRYKGDPSQMDRNERALDYQAAVVENIEWIRKNYNEIAHIARVSDPLKESFRRQDMVNKGIFEPLRHEAYRAFQFNVIYITDSAGNLRPLEQIADEVMDLQHTSF